MINKQGENDLYKKAIESWGVSGQLNMVTEECSELLVAINKYRRDPNEDNEKYIAEEMADVEILLGELKVIFRNETLVAEIKQQKLERLKKRLDQPNYSQRDKTLNEHK